ncbi:MAG: hypothetical protein PR2021_2530 [Candidatus Phytoplasma pruni]|uniref:hypothetical protein n=1 Tax=Poinsettia branch-inducing phytoplasma TaxID=138647 RepID=UPI00036F563E|nr:hypothetical protein [Poinsettia branch-inducing phytoplasma]WEK82325.1 MAG: hypothetical protein PR2021_2530 [Candidatus Phytoplasma pruni]
MNNNNLVMAMDINKGKQISNNEINNSNFDDSEFKEFCKLIEQRKQIIQLQKKDKKILIQKIFLLTKQNLNLVIKNKKPKISI